MDDPALPVPDPVMPGSPSRDSATPERPAPRLLPPLTAPAPTSPVRGPGWRAGIALALIAFLIGAGIAALLVVRFVKSDAKPLATVTVPVGANGQAPLVIVPNKAAVAAPALELAALSNREASLATELAALEARAGTIDRDSQRASTYATRSQALMIAFAARRAIDRGLNLGFLEGQLRARFASLQPAAVATVVQAAREPVTLEDLRAGLDAVTPELLTGAASNGWWQSLRDELGHLIVLRRAGTPSPLPVDRVARARRLLEAGQVEAALAEVSRTPGVAQAERWTSAARRYVDVRRALDTIESAAILAPGPDTVPPAAAAPARADNAAPADSTTPQARTRSINAIAPCGARTFAPLMKKTKVSRGVFGAGSAR
ncbi:hypothetical protein [Sphingomonas sp. PAMC 26605]|uniref:hypothetical protein n=1 Tax=Sphingomonas sp. PAMC 26605 TaxID=1112214 RepID=UPI0018DEEDB5|nr:hypothetical protein [Sphingomonas sp. PAMC 26605]